MAEMTRTEIKKFLMNNAYAGELATVRKNGSSHVVPICFVLDEGKKQNKIDDISFTPGFESIKYKIFNVTEG